MITRQRRGRPSDEGVALVMALVFILIVALFMTVALRKSQTTLASGQEVRSRGNLQYALDAGVEKTFQVLRSELIARAPDKCTDPADDAYSGSLTLNLHTVEFTCRTLGGRAALTGSIASNYAVLVTGSSPGDFTTQSGVGDDMLISGSVYINAKTSTADIKKPMTVENGDVAAGPGWSGCAADLAALDEADDISLSDDTSGFLMACTEQAVLDAIPSVVLPSVPAAAAGALTVGTCKIFFPGKYATAPPVENRKSHYFVSGTYYFENIGRWSIPNQATILGGKAATGDLAAPFTSNCSAMSDTLALAQPLAPALTPATSGVRWIFGGSSAITNSGQIALNSPPAAAGLPSLNIIAVRSADAGVDYVRSAPTGTPTGAWVLDSTDPASVFVLNAKIFAPENSIRYFAASPTVTYLRNGVIAQRLDLKASANSTGFSVSAPAGVATPPPPFRTVEVVVRADGGSSAINTAIATVSNYSPYSVTVKSWRTGTD